MLDCRLKQKFSKQNQQAKVYRGEPVLFVSVIPVSLS